MRLQSLHLIAFGPFTGKILDFSSGEHGLHIVYGQNESGKSSSLRALRQALYGIPNKSDDNFIHPNAEMRVGIVLKHSDGSQLRLVRRKGNIKTLRVLDSENEIIEQAQLQRYLGNINQTAFEQRFGIDHPTLVSGGKSVLEGSGELGELLFSAGAGIADLRQVLDGLEKEYQELYARNAQARPINRQMAELTAAKAELRDSELPNGEWEKHDGAFRRYNKEKERVSEALRENQQRHSRLLRYRTALTIIPERDYYLKQLQELTEQISLPESFEEEARELLKSALLLKNSQTQTEESLARLSQDLDKLHIPQVILDQAAGIEALQQKLGSHEKAAGDRRGLEQNFLEEQDRARICLRDLGRGEDFAATANLKLSAQEKSRLRKLALERRSLWQGYEDSQALRQRTDLQLRQNIEKLEKMAKLPACEKLQVCYKRYQQDPQIEERYTEQRKNLDRNFKQILLDLKKLQLKDIGESVQIDKSAALNSTLHSLSLPDSATIENYERNFNQLQTDLDKHKAASEDLNNQLTDIHYRLQEHDMQIAAPTEKDLSEIRHLRNAGWNLVLKLWKSGDKSAHDSEAIAAQLADFLSGTESSELGAGYEWAMEKSDTIADRLRHEADHVAQKVQLTLQMQKLQASIAAKTSKLEETESLYTQLKNEWTVIWSEITEKQLLPSSAKLWINQLEQTRQSVAQLVENQEFLDQQKTGLDKAKNDLVNALLDSGWSQKSGQLSSAVQTAIAPATETALTSTDTEVSFLSLLEAAQILMDNLKEAQQEQATLEKDINRLQGELLINKNAEETKKADLDNWAANWQPAVEGLGLSATTSPEELTAFLDKLDQFFSNHDQMQTLKRRIDGIDRDADQFRSEVKQLLSSLASATETETRALLPQLEKLPPEQCARELFILLRNTREQDNKKRMLSAQKKSQLNELETGKRSLQEVNDKLSRMIAEAHVGSEDELLDAAKKSQQKNQLSRQLDAYDRQIIGLAEGVPLEEFIAECSNYSAEQLITEIKTLEEQSAGLEKELEDLQIAIGSEKQILLGMNGSAKAAETALRVQQILSEMGQEVEQYSRLRVASFLLKKAIERYREKNQNPILKNAGSIFAALSNGAFSGLQEDYNEKGDAAIFGLRHGSGSQIPVEAMSDGTRDQLYLSIRLAALILYLEQEEPLPFIVDDILVNFDDQRSLSTLKLLSDLSEKTQIIMFTHHSHIVEICKKNLPASSFFIHELDKN